MNRLTGLVLLLLFVWGGSYITAETIKSTLSTYYLPTNYTNVSNKADQSVMGLYAYVGQGLNHSYEIGYDRFNDDSGTSIQTSLTGIYTRYFPNQRYRVGGSLIDTTADTFEGFTLIAGYDYDHYSYSSKEWTVGGNVYFTSHDIGGKTETIIQLSPSYTTYFYPTIIPGYMSAKTQLTVINASKRLGAGQDKTLSISEQLNYYLNQQWTITLDCWAGEEIYAFHNGGFVNYNLDETHLYGIGLYATYQFNAPLRVQSGVHYQVFNQANTSNRSSLTKLLLMLSYSFSSK